MARKTKQQDMPAAQTLQWVPAKSGRRAFELRSENETIARIRWPKLLGTLAEAEFGDEHWTFKRVGFLRPRVTIRLAGEPEDSAVLELSCGGGGGLLKTESGRLFHWNRQGFWTHRFAFTDESGAELVVIEPKFGLLRRRWDVSVSSKASKVSELPLLLLLGCYVTMLMAEDDAAVDMIISS